MKERDLFLSSFLLVRPGAGYFYCPMPYETLPSRNTTSWHLAFNAHSHLFSKHTLHIQTKHIATLGRTVTASIVLGITNLPCMQEEKTKIKKDHILTPPRLCTAPSRPKLASIFPPKWESANWSWLCPRSKPCPCPATLLLCKNDKVCSCPACFTLIIFARPSFSERSSTVLFFYGASIPDRGQPRLDVWMEVWVY